MPIFDYRCKDCSEEFEFFILRSSDTPSCPQCSSLNLTKKTSSFSVGSAGNKTPAPNAKQAEPTGHTCTSTCNHGSVSGKGHHTGCGVSIADSLRKKYGYT